MKKRISKVFTALTVIFILFVVSACGNQPSADVLDNETEIEESTIETETIESEEETAEKEETEEPLQTASSHQHNIDAEEKMKETDAEEEVLEEEREEEVKTQTTTQKKETDVQTSSETTTAPTAETTTVTAPSTPNMGQLEEWMPPQNMLVVCDANVVDENGNVLGSIAKGSDIGVTGQCPGFYQVNYGAKRSFLPKDCLSSR